MPLDIVLFAVIAVFLIYRLRSVLGTRHGAERDYPNPFSDRADKKTSSDNMEASLAEVKEPAQDAKERVVVSMNEKISVSDKASVQSGLIEIASMDENFNVQEFITGAKGAFALIVGAYASGDKDTLKPLLSSTLYSDFEQGIKAREKAKQTLTMELHSIQQAKVIDARLGGTMAYVTIDFDVEETSVLRDKTDEIIDGNPEEVTRMTDIWTFAHDVRSTDPNWILTETRTGK